MLVKEILPLFVSGKVIRGFRRGTEMGFPTANFPVEVVRSLPSDFATGIYCGWAQVDTGDVHKMVMSVGWNPFFDNKEKSMETHILHQFPEDFYDQTLKVCVVHYLRPETNFTTLENLKKAINKDVEDAKELLNRPEFLKFQSDPFFSSTTINGHL
ncbi:putative riboflavin kinase [Phlebotomus papatasi]|uniref:riboflavin kinase n=1 Tax=Phlebotomus papatasi TaxID=29031 RepID=A0A1B0D6A1_PHLPP|nr:putative riboflavin kinase [Phlebotomus papatasi]